MRETEVKILEINRSEIEQRLISMGAQYQFTKEIGAIILDDPDHSIHKNGNLLRLRKKGEDNILTFKKQITRTGAKIMQEFEIRVSDFETTRALLHQLGYIEALTLRKTRTEYKLGEVKVVFDKYHDDLEHIPEFIEIETEDIRLIYEFVPLLGFSPEDCLPWGVKELMAHYQQLRK